MSSVTTTMTTSQPSHNDAAVETSASQKEGPRSCSWHRYRRHIVWDATVWVLFLALPIIQLLLREEFVLLALSALKKISYRKS